MEGKEIETSSNEFAIVDKKVYPSVPASNYESKTDSYFDGNMLELWAFLFLRIFITTFTVGIMAPFGKCIYYRYIYSHTIYNGKRLKFEGEGIDLFPLYFKWNFFRVITFGIYSFWIPTRYKEWELEHVHFEDEPLVKGESYFTGTVGGFVGINILTWLIKICSFGLLLPLAQVIKLRWILNHSVINRKKLVFEGNSLNFILKKIGWMLLSGITFGIYGLWVPIKTQRWEVSNTRIMRKNELNGTKDSKESGLNKKSLFIIIGVIAVLLIIIITSLVKVFGKYGPYDPSKEDEMVQTAEKFLTEIQYGNIKLNSSSTTYNIKNANSEVLNVFINNGGTGEYSYYETNGEIDYLDLTLVKNTNVCEFYYDSNYKSFDYHCKSYRVFKKDQRSSGTAVKSEL